MIWALDLATQTGHCLGDGSKDPILGGVRMPDTGEDVGPFLDFFEKWMTRRVNVLLDAAAAAGSAPLIGMEAPVLPRGKFNIKTGRYEEAKTTITTQRKLQGLAGIAEMVAYRAKVPIREMANSTIKKELAGHGHAEKSDMMIAAQRMGLKPRTNDEADAFGVWLVMVRFYAKQWAAGWDQRLHSSRGAMI